MYFCRTKFYPLIIIDKIMKSSCFFLSGPVRLSYLSRNVLFGVSPNASRLRGNYSTIRGIIVENRPNRLQIACETVQNETVWHMSKNFAVRMLYIEIWYHFWGHLDLLVQSMKYISRASTHHIDINEMEVSTSYLPISLPKYRPKWTHNCTINCDLQISALERRHA